MKWNVINKIDFQNQPIPFNKNAYERIGSRRNITASIRFYRINRPGTLFFEFIVIVDEKVKTIRVSVLKVTPAKGGSACQIKVQTQCLNDLEDFILKRI